MNHSIWASGGLTAKIEADTLFLAVLEFCKNHDLGYPLYVGGTAIGSNCAYYTTGGNDIKVWRTK